MDGCFGFLLLSGAIVFALWLRNDVARRLRTIERSVDDANRARFELASRLAKAESALHRLSEPNAASHTPEAAVASAAPDAAAVEREPAAPIARAAFAAAASAPPFEIRDAGLHPTPAAPVPASPGPVFVSPTPQRQPITTPRVKTAPAFDWESLVGVRLFSWIAGAALVLAALFFLRYSVEQGWLSPPVRMAMGFAAGIALLVLCELKAANRYRVTANAMDAAAIAILFATLFAGHALWRLLPLGVAFALMAVVTAIAVTLSVRRDSLFIALLGLAGGFATPALLPLGGERSVALFGYLLLLNAGLAWIAYRKRWPLLSLLSLAATTAHQWHWVLRFLDETKLGFATAIFLLFPLLGAALLLVGGRRLRSENDDPMEESFGQLAAIGSVLPLFFAAYLAAVPAFAAHRALLFGYLAAIVVGLTALALARGPGMLHLCGGLGALLVFALWIARGHQPGDWTSALALLVGFALLFLTTPIVARALGRPLVGPAELGVLVAPLLTLLIAALVLRAPEAATPGPLLLALLVSVVASGGAALRLGHALLAIGAPVAAQFVLLVWPAAREAAPAPTIAVAAALAVGLLAFALLHLADRASSGGEQRFGFLAGAVAALFLAQLTTIETTGLLGRPAFGWIAGAALAGTSAILVLAARERQLALAPCAVIPILLLQAAFRLESGAPPAWSDQLLLAFLLWAPLLLFPFLLGERSRKATAPFLAAVLGAGAAFPFAKEAIERGGLESILGLLPIVQGALLAPLLLQLLRLEPPVGRDAGARGRLALVAGAILAFVTVAIPLQLEKQWLTLGWALLGAALAWLRRRLDHRGLLLWTAGLHAAVVVRLALNPAVLSYHPRSELPILNWYLYTYLVAAASLFTAAWLLRGSAERSSEDASVPPLLAAGGTTLLFLLLNIEIADFWSEGSTLTFAFLSGAASLGEDLSYTIGWALFGIALLGAGIAGRSRGARIAAIALLAATVAKAFLHDTWKLGGLYRIGSLVGLAVSLALVAIVLQRFVLARPPADE